MTKQSTPAAAFRKLASDERGAINFNYILLCALVALGLTLGLQAFAEGSVAPAFLTDGERLLCYVTGGSDCGGGVARAEHAQASEIPTEAPPPKVPSLVEEDHAAVDPAEAARRLRMEAIMRGVERAQRAAAEAEVYGEVPLRIAQSGVTTMAELEAAIGPEALARLTDAERQQHVDFLERQRVLQNDPRLAPAGEITMHGGYAWTAFGIVPPYDALDLSTPGVEEALTGGWHAYPANGEPYDMAAGRPVQSRADLAPGERAFVNVNGRVFTVDAHIMVPGHPSELAPFSNRAPPAFRNDG